MLKDTARLRGTAWMTGVLAFIGLFPLVEPATAGQLAAAPASIVGQVTDGTGAVLPGVAVTATSPALQVPQVITVTDERGDYRLTPLPNGTYTVTYELAGFQRVRRENVLLTVGFVARVDVAMNLGAVTESITVSGASPVVDITSTATRTELTGTAVSILPTTRDGLKAFMGQVPSIRTNLAVGSQAVSDGVVFRVYGQTGDSWQMVEGVISASPARPGRSGSHVDFNSVDGTRIQTVGSNAEMPRRGILVDTILKSGGNEFHGGAEYYGSSGRFEGGNIDDKLEAFGLRNQPKLQHLVDLSGNLGGRIVRNKLWFFGSGRFQSFDREVYGAFFDDGSPAVVNQYMYFQIAKGSYQMTPGNRFVGVVHRNVDFARRGIDQFTPEESREEQWNPVTIWKGEWQAVRGNSLATSLQYGEWLRYTTYDGLAPGKVATSDISTQFVSGDRTSDGRRPREFRRHTKGVVSWYRSDLLAGNHEFKAGIDHMYSGVASAVLSRRSGNYELLFNNGAPFQINTFNYPVAPTNSGNYLGLYAQDAWTMARRLTLNLGIRYAYDNAYAPPQCREAGDFVAAQCWDKVQMKIWNSFSPRLYAAIDVTGNGKTVIKGGCCLSR